MRKYKVGDEVRAVDAWIISDTTLPIHSSMIGVAEILPDKTYLNYREVAQKFSGQKGIIKQLSTVSTIYEVEFIHQPTLALSFTRAWFDDSWLMPAISRIPCNCPVSKILLRGCKDPNHF